MKKILAAILLAAGATAVNAVEVLDGNLTGNMTITSNYEFRGISLSQNGPAIQGGIDFNHSTGLYIGNWNSSYRNVPNLGDDDVDANSGNVSVYADGHDMTVEDFRISAKVSAVALCNPDYTLGEKIYYAVKATREAVGCNTNLGILLLCAPLIQAVAIKTPETTLQQALAQVLDNTTLNDADWVFKAISLASPGGLGSAEQADVSEMPTINLTEAMRLASLRDRIALQFVSNYQDIFDFALPIYYNAHKKWCKQDWSALAVYVSLLCRFPDSHIERKYGRQHNRLIANKMAQLSDELSKVESPELTLT